jgi:hypothetical protein
MYRTEDRTQSGQHLFPTYFGKRFTIYRRRIALGDLARIKEHLQTQAVKDKEINGISVGQHCIKFIRTEWTQGGIHRKKLCGQCRENPLGRC